MVHRSVTRRRCNDYRAKTSTNGDVNIVNQKLREGYDKGTFWAGIGFVLVMGPLLVMHALGWF